MESGTWDKMKRTFIEVRDTLNTTETQHAFRLCWKKPWRFYREHTAEEAIEILKREAKEDLK